MCAHHIQKNKVAWQTLLWYTLAILLGIFSGTSEIIWLKNIGLTLSEIFIKLFKCLSLPLISLSIIATITKHFEEVSMKYLGRRILTYTLGTTIIAATVSCGLYLLIQPSTHSPTAIDTQLATIKQTSYITHLSQLIPNDIFEPFLQHQVMGVLLIAIALGIAIRAIPNHDAQKIVAGFFQGLHSVFITFTRWLVKLIPLALYGFITATVVQLQNGLNLSGLGEYLSVIVLANLIQGLIILPLWLKWNGIAVGKTMHGMMPALSLAFFSKSSAGTLPVTIDCAERRLGIDHKIAQFSLPLCTTINMNGCAAFIFATVIYLMQSSGIEINLVTMFLWIFVATIAAVGNAGVPMGCFFLSLSLLSSMGVPVNLMGLILPFYTLIDMLETALNVWSDACVTQVIDHQIRRESIAIEG